MQTNLDIQDTVFLNRSRTASSLAEVVNFAPMRFHSTPIEEVDFPVRLTNRLKMKKIQTLGQMRTLDLNAMQGKNLGARTLEVAKESLAKFITKKISQPVFGTLREMMEDFGKDLLEREANIWQMRAGLLGERQTLEYIGNKFGLTRERVRQIEFVLFAQFAKRYIAVKYITAYVTDGMTFAELIAKCGGLIELNDPLPVSFVLENLDQKLYLVLGLGKVPVVSVRSPSELRVDFNRTSSIAEKILRDSPLPMRRAEFMTAFNRSDAEKMTKEMMVATLDYERAFG